mmetsp:Transcript_13420/g.28536  ORF Transcript_13420/g.28536 Transcript_13420/m.28536 type:complete len:205 (-) Transcript_13420:204-818(-)
MSAYSTTPAMAAQRKAGALSSSHRNNTRPPAAFRRVHSRPRQNTKQAAHAKMYVPTDAFGGLNPEQVAANVLKKTTTLASMEVIRIREEKETPEQPSYQPLNEFMEENPYRPASAWTEKLTSSEEGDLKTAANTLFCTREEYLAEGAIAWDSVKASTVNSLQEEDAELMREYMMNSMTLSMGDDLEVAETEEEPSIGKNKEDNQ